ncbi:glutamyl-tRNA synthetase [Cnuella takakiae]|uniref:Glutamyl-tRNA synthetase n=1 Tax=Cnuella takakiae TaxID=1302690 RepID=A0A1M5J4E0_9BACT|nr:glutamate--tRNA ligase family protein [Cnuella takakiae]OLY91447.1 hypothetical protein BUE76_05670 [Cnuella takakiae]SHG35402.1 glutamyl-tRNA synthetase [Cnuella takakiae]
MNPVAAPNRFFRTRLAPTPSGYLHLGNILSFVITVGLARQSGARILLRIDDLDRKRVRPQYLQDIFDTLQFLELPWDEGPRNVADFQAVWSQQHRMPLYRQVLNPLQTLPELFACTCSRTDILKLGTDGIYPGTCRHKGLPLDTPGAAWRLRTPEAVSLQVKMLQGSSSVTQLPAVIRDFVVRKKDGTPAYQLASVVDDEHFGVDLVVRGADLWPSTQAQLYLARLLDKKTFARTRFVHHALVRDAGGEKLSKSAGASSVWHLRKEGKTHSEVYQLLAQWCGIATPVQDWQALFDALLAGQPQLLHGVSFP